MQLVPALLGLTLLAWLVCESQQQFGQRMGPYDIDVQQVYPCKDQGNGKGKFNMSLYLGPPDPASRKRKRLHKGSYSWPFTPEETKRVEWLAEYFQKKSNDFLVMYKNSDSFCNTLEILGGKLFQSLQEAIGQKIDGCGMPMGNYTFNDWEIPFSLPTPMLEYGHYKAIVKFLLDGELFGCFTGLGEIKPKKT